MPGTMTKDPELTIMARMDRMLEQLDRRAAVRVLEWLMAKYDDDRQLLPGDPSFRKGTGANND